MKTTDKIIRWLPRIICILSILLVSMFAFDVFSPELTVWQQILALLMHLIPSFVLTAILIIAWKWELAGGIILTIVGVICMFLVFNLNYHRNHFTLAASLRNASLICLPFVIAGILFILSHFRSKRT